MQNEPVVVEATYPVSASSVWEALTDNEKMRGWYFTLEQFEPRVGFEFSFTGTGRKGETYVHNCRITEVVPQRRLQYSWRYAGRPGSSLVTFELVPESAQTTLSVTHEGIESFAGEGSDFSKESFREGWTSILTQSLRNYLEAQSG